MKYVHYTQVNGDALIQTILKCQSRMQKEGKYNAACSCYAIRKARSLPYLHWREPAKRGEQYKVHVTLGCSGLPIGE